MNEQPQTEQPASEPQAAPSVEEQRAAFSTEVKAENASDADRLGHLAARHEVTADEHGNLLTKQDLQEVAAGNVAVKE